jgi:hypothetical protein
MGSFNPKAVGTENPIDPSKEEKYTKDVRKMWQHIEES